MDLNILPITLDGTGAEVPAFDVTIPYQEYWLKGTVIAIGNYALAPSNTPIEGSTIVFYSEAVVDITTNGTTFQIFGNQVSQDQLSNPFVATCRYDGSTWTFHFIPTLADGVASITSDNIVSLNGAKIENSTIDGSAKLINQSVTNSEIADATIVGSAKLVALSVTDAEIANLDGSKINAGTVSNTELANMADLTVKGNTSGGASSPQDIPISTLFGDNAWLLGGNSGTVAGTNFLGTTDAIDLVFKTNSVESGRIGITLGNTSFGFQALLNAVSGANVAIGQNSLLANTSGTGNTAVGTESMINNINGAQNTALGQGSLNGNTDGTGNVSVGYGSLNSNSSGIYNIGIGVSSSPNNLTGNYNIAIGDNTLAGLTNGSENTIIGHNADVDSATAVNRIALGSQAVATADYQFAIPTNVSTLNFALNSHNPNAFLTSDGSGIGTWSTSSVNTTAGDSATINTQSGRFRKDTSGSTFTLTNSFINSNSIILLQMVQLDATATRAVVLAGSGSATITFDAAPTSNLDVNFLVIG